MIDRVTEIGRYNALKMKLEKIR